MSWMTCWSAAAFLLVALARAAPAEEAWSDLVDQPTIRHVLWGITFDLPVPNRVCDAGPPLGMGRIVIVRIGSDSECRSPESRANVEFWFTPEHYDVALEKPYPPIRREIARGECYKGFEPVEATFREAARIGGLPAFLCRRIGETREGTTRIVTTYFAFRGFSGRGDPPSPLYPAIQYTFTLSTAPEHEYEGLAILNRIVRTVKLLPL